VSLHDVLPILQDVFVYSVVGLIGVINFELFFPPKLNFREIIGFSIITGFVSIGISLILSDHIAFKILMTIISYFTGFLTPFVKTKEGKRLVKIIYKGYRNAKTIKSSIESEIGKELEK
jgi:hypothetical protein